MLRVTVLQVGKTKSVELQALLDDYAKRMRRSIDLRVTTVKDEAKLWTSVDWQAQVIVLDDKGDELDSGAFADWLHAFGVRGQSHVQFLIGPADGFALIPPQARHKVSLSRLTFSHQTVRLLLFEQLYRASTLWEGKPFAK